MRSKRARFLGVAVVAGIAVLQLSSEFLGARDAVRLLSKSLALLVGLPVLVVCAFEVFRWATRNRIGVAGPLSVAAIATGVFFAALLLATRAVSLSFVSLPPNQEPYGAGDVLRVGFTMGITYFALWALVFVLPIFLEDARVRTLEAEKLRTQAEFAQLRSHLEPHFLLNTLNTIAGLVTEDPRKARQLIGNLGDLLRDSVAPGREMQTLDEQIAWLRRYAQILETRHAGHLAFRWDIGDGTPRALLPTLLLQPLVENAVKHGALMRAGGGEIVVRTELSGPRLVCTVEDNGPGIADKRTGSGAFGPVPVCRRRELRHGRAGRRRREPAPAGGRCVGGLPRERGAPP